MTMTPPWFHCALHCLLFPEPFIRWYCCPVFYVTLVMLVCIWWFHNCKMWCYVIQLKWCHFCPVSTISTGLRWSLLGLIQLTALHLLHLQSHIWGSCCPGGSIFLGVGTIPMIPICIIRMPYFHYIFLQAIMSQTDWPLIKSTVGYY